MLNVFQGQLSQFCHLFGKSIPNICSSVSFFCLNTMCQKVLRMFDKSSAVTTLPNNWKNESQSIFKSVKQVNLHIFLYYIVFNSPKHNCVQICRISKPLNIPIYCIQLTLTQLCTKVFISSHCVHQSVTNIFKYSNIRIYWSWIYIQTFVRINFSFTNIFGHSFVSNLFVRIYSDIRWWVC